MPINTSRFTGKFKLGREARNSAAAPGRISESGRGRSNQATSAHRKKNTQRLVLVVNFASEVLHTTGMR